MLLVLLYFVLFLGICYYLYTRPYGYWKSKGVPFEQPFFIFGSLPRVALRKEHFFDTICRLYNKFKGHPYFGIYSFNKPTLIVTSPELLRKILVRDFDKFTDTNLGPSEDADPLGFHSLFSASGEVWKALRTKISPVFTSGKMKLMLPLMEECAVNVIDVLGKCNGEEIELRYLMKRYTVDIISSCAFGVNAHCLKDENSEMKVMAFKLLDFSSFARSFSVFCFFFFPKLSSFLRLKFGDVTASNYLLNAFKSALKRREEDGIVRNDLIELLSTMRKNETLTEEYKFDDVKMAAQAIAFFSAGNDTTATTISFTLYELALQQDIQNRLREEVRRAYEKHGSFTYEALQEMKYLEMVLSETLRKYPLASFLNRQNSVDYKVEETGFVMEKNTAIIVPVCALHYDPEYFPDPQKYDPERFSDKNKHNIKPYTYMPFGEGPRNCIGQRFGLLVSKVALSNIIKSFAFTPTGRTAVPIVFAPEALFLQSKGGLYLRVTKV